MPKEDGNGSIEDDDDGTVDVIVEGNALSAEMARIDIQKIADEKAATVTHKLRGIPSEFYPFIAGPRNERIQALEDGRDVRVHVPSNIRPGQVPQFAAIGQPPNFSPAPPDLPITVSGDRHAVQDIRAAIERQAQELRRQLTAEQFPINRGRHQFIVGDRGIPSHQFLADTGCAIILPSDDDDETITIIGPADQVSAGVERAMDLASSMHSTSLDLSRHLRNVQGGAAAHARNLVRYLQQRREIERLERMHNAHIVTPIASEGVAPWELYSREGKNALRAQSEIMNILNGLPPSRMATMDVDPFFHQHLRKDVLPKVQQDYGVHTIIPREESSSPVLLVFEGPSGMEADYQVPRTQPSTVEQQQFQEALTSARQYIANIIGQQEEIISRSIDVPEKFHDKLKRFIKNEQQDRSIEQIPVRVTSNRSIVTMRGPKPAVESLLQKVEAFVAQAIADEKERGFTMSFDFPQKHANQLIGKGGSNIKELRERFDVEIQVDNGKVELKGPKAKCEAAKSHIISQGKQWADDTTHTLKVEPKYHGDLIGAQGSQINKLQTRYKVQIHFPRSARPAKDDQSVADGSDAGQKAPRRQQAEDEVVVRGPSKGADEARDEILSLLQYLKDNSYSATVSVKQNQIPSLIGQGGKGMEELRQLTGAKIDIPRSRDATDVEIQIKGTKAQVAQAKKLIEEKRDVFNQTVAKTLDVEKKHHRALIGPGGKCSPCHVSLLPQNVLQCLKCDADL
jgi:transcription antitermination factor NusA-like protein